MASNADFKLRQPLLPAEAPQQQSLKSRLYRLFPRSWRASWEHVPVRPQGRWCPEEEAGLISRAFFSFVGSLIAMGYSHPLVQEDLWDLAAWDESEEYSSIFQKHLHATRTPEHPQGVIWRAAMRSHFEPILVAGLFRFTWNIVSFVSPYILELLLGFIATGGSPGVGLGLAIALFASQMVAAVSLNRFWATINHVTLGLKAQYVDMIYVKSLRMSNSVKGSMGVGAIVNLQSNDAQKLWNVALYIHSTWSCPLQIIVTVVLLIRILGYEAALAGLGVAIVLIPVSSFVGKYQRAARMKLIACTDARLKLTTEVVTGIKAIKLYAWEEPYVERILQLRAAELRQIRISFLLNAVNNVVFLGGPILISLAGFATYAALGFRLTAEVAFPALAYFNLLRVPLIELPDLIQQVINAAIGIRRIQAFLESPDRETNEELPAAKPGQPAVWVRGGRFSWGEAAGEAPVLDGIELEVAAGRLVMIVGEVGCGKTSLLSVILGELHRQAGEVGVRGSIAYTAQDPWIQNASLRDNVLMGAPLEPARYSATLSACALDPDIAMLPAGDLTEIGEKGVNLSGGQRHRVALARAVYAQADVYLLDDPLSAVDAHVGRKLFDGVICGQLASRTRLLVTHQVQYLAGADVVVVIKDGRIAQMGSPQELQARGIDFADFQAPELEAPSENIEATGLLSAVPSMPALALPASSSAASSSSDDGSPSDDESSRSPLLGTAAGGAAGKPHAGGKGLGDGEKSQIQAAFDIVTPEKKSKGNDEEADGEKGKLIVIEERATGKVDNAIYRAYLAAWSPFFILPITWVTLCVGERGLQSLQNWWLSVWTNGVAREEAAGAAPRDLYYLEIYFIFGLLSIVFQFVREVTMVYGANKAANRLHGELLSKVVRLPMSFFDTQPTGRLLNRFSKDTEYVDLLVANSFNWLVVILLSVLGSLIIIAASTPYILLALLPLAAIYRRVQVRFIATSREVKRLDSLAFSPIFANFSETLVGLVTLRAFRKQPWFHNRNLALLDNSNRCYWSQIMVNRWLGMRLETIGAAIVFATAVFVALVLRRSAGVAGLAITSALNLTGLLSTLVRISTELEVNMNGVERIVEYTRLAPERAAIVPGNRPPASWPREGAISVEGLWLRYRPELDPVLKGLTFAVRGREKIGVAGRTGCGKSTLMMALYRLVEPSGGRIVIDGVDTAAIGLFDLRSRLALVPQDPVIFSGTVRDNLDPFGTSGGDGDIWQALRQAGMEGVIKAQEGGKGLDAHISEGGGNLSTGQRQLLCMARALLRKSRILVLDEATSNVDNTTDSLIQSTIRTAFKDCTVLTIAHRLHTIIDSDRVLVLEAGEVLEFDSPHNLLKDPSSAFFGLVESTKLAHG